MAKYMVLYYSSMKASQLMANASMDQMKASMAEWQKWKDNAGKTAKIEFGMPLEAVKHVTPEGGWRKQEHGWRVFDYGRRFKGSDCGTAADAPAFEKGGSFD